MREEGGDTLYMVAAQGEEMGLVNQVDNATDLTATYRFNGEGVLLETTASIKGTTGEGADALPASEDFTVAYSDWGATTVPFAPPATGIYEVGDGLSFDEDLAEVLAKMPKNFTCIMETAVTLFEGDVSLSRDMRLETYVDESDGLRALVYLEAPDGGIDEMYTYLDDGRVTASVNGEVVSADYNYESEDPTGLGQAAQLVGCAEVVGCITYGNGEVEYVLFTDPQKVSDAVDMDGWGELALCEAHYMVSAEGELVYMTLNVEGVPENADMADYMAAETVAQYSDFNSTEVFNPFA
ncbi:hypothetical protein VJ923_11675 [Adlercreutzia sp. R25]|uniref:Lipoprotein n=1 Tax=Adlercreutzia shanghongiae TaxID=3111773 RepID=A0ABU6IWH3_9ACTN|nr:MULTISPECIES: hypothetical protein [unclassified Adlercreutzia]MEC4273816.1 hypothetical protein [Adlercreutzia sp. R25]MEC4294128.1 hypothetical protein [Adlercreutzia sp. R22]